MIEWKWKNENAWMNKINSWKFMKMNENEWKWMEMNDNEWMKMNEWKWMIEMNEWTWMIKMKWINEMN